ncbi:MAG: hypothetical protein EPO07_12185 [Verrucomicrobia bacterium]|nr:MAG: hypothetical protein EPO07_12185 [Verrucomicrobiota bacterium]
MKTFLHHLRTLTLGILSLLVVPLAPAASFEWTGASGADVLWATAANWNPSGVPGASDSPIFGVTATVGDAVTVNNTVGTSTNVTALSYTNSTSGSWHVTQIPSGVSLTVSGTVTVGGATGTGSPLLVTSAAMVGGGTLIANGTAFNVGNGGSAGGLNSGTILNLSALTNFYYSASGGTLGIGAVNRSIATLNLAAGSNFITAATISLNTGSSSSSGNGVALRFGPGTNNINANTFNIGANRTSATAQFTDASGGLRLRGTGGTDADRCNMTLGNRNAGSSTGGTTTGTLALNGHPVDMKFGTLTVGAQNRAGTEAGLIGSGVFQFDQGTVDVTTINMAVCNGNSPTAGARGTLTVGASGTLTVGSISMANVTSPGVGANATGTLNISGGLVDCTGDIVKTTLTLSTNTVAIDAGGRLYITGNGRVGTTAIPTDNLNLTNATLQLNPTAGVTNVVVTTLTTDGANTIDIGQMPSIISYPVTFRLIKYQGVIGGAGYNFTLTGLPGSFTGSLVNNSANSSVDLTITAGPVAQALTWLGTTNGNWNILATKNWRVGTTSTNFFDGDFVTFDDTVGGTTAVNVAVDVSPGSVTFNNSSVSYTLTGSGKITGLTGLTKQGSGTVVLNNTGVNDFIGSTTVSGGTLQVGNGGTSGNLGGAAITMDAGLTFNRSDDIAVANIISGNASGNLTKNGAGVLTLSAANTFTGAVTVAQGTLKPANNSALGRTNGITTIASGATLDFGVNTINIGLEPLSVSGDGVGGNGAIINSSGNAAFSQPNVAFVTMTGNTRFGGTGRWDLRSAGGTTGDPATAGLSTGGQPHSLTKVGTNGVYLVSATVDGALGDIDVTAGLLSFEGNTTSAGNRLSNLTVRAGATLQLFAITNRLDKVITLNGTGTNNTVNNASGANTVIGPMTLNGDCIFNAGGTSLTLSNTITGGAGGNLIKTGGNTLVLSGGDDTYSGNTTVSNGTLIVNNNLTGGGTLTTLTNTTLGGTGTNTGPVIVGGTLAPGTSAGTFGSGNLTLNTDATLSFELNTTTTIGSGVNDLIQVAGNVTANNNSIVINLLGAALQAGTYRLINYTGSLIGSFNSTVTIAGGASRYGLTLDTSTLGQVNLIVSGGPGNLRWDSVSSSAWDIATTTNWFNLGTSASDAFFQSDSVLFDDTAGLQVAIDIAAGVTVSPAAMTNNSTAGGNNFIITGAGKIAGGTGIVKLGDSTLTIGTTNSHTGGLSVEAGTVRLTGASAGGAGLLKVKATGTLVVGAAHTNSITLTNATLGVANADFAMSTASELTVLGPNGSTIQSSDPQNAATSRNIQVDGTLRGSGNILIKNADNITNPDGNQGVRFRGTTASDYSGTITVDNNAKSEMRVAGAGPFSPVGTGKFILTCGAYNGGNTVNSPGSGGYLEFNIRNNNTVGNGDTYIGNDFELTGSGAVVLNLLSDGTGAPAGAIATLGNLKIGGGQELIGYRGSGNIHVAKFSSVTLTGGDVTFSPKSQTFGAVGQVGADFILSNITEQAASSLTMAGLRTLTLSGTNAYTGDTTVAAGTLALLGNTALTNSPNIVLGAGAVLDVSGRTDGTLALRAGQTLSGNGTVRGILIANAATTVSPGASVGALTVTNTVTLLGTNVMEIDKTGFTNDVLRSSVSIAYGGRLVLSALNIPYGAGDSFKLFDAPAYSGKFTTLDPATPGAGLQWNTNDLVTAGTLKVVATGPVPKPKVASFTYSGFDVSLNGTNGPAYSQYQLLSSTNIVLPTSAWTAIRTNYFDGVGDFSETGIPVDPNDPQRFYFIRIQLP